MYPTSDGANGDMIVTNGAGAMSFATPLSTFLQLTDTPSAFTSAGSFFVRVNSGATALEFTQDVDDGTF